MLAEPAVLPLDLKTFGFVIRADHAYSELLYSQRRLQLQRHCLGQQAIRTRSCRMVETDHP